MTNQETEQEVQAKGLTAPRITPADVEASIAVEHYFTGTDGLVGAGDGIQQLDAVNHGLRLVTFCILIMKNGTKIVGINHGPVSPENFDAAEGRKYARENAIDQIWPLLGYELRTKLAGAKDCCGKCHAEDGDHRPA